MQTFFIVQASGAKLRGGGEIKPEDLWKLDSDQEEKGEIPSWAATTIELRKSIIKELQK